MPRHFTYLLVVILLFTGITSRAQQFSFFYPEANNDLPQQFIYALQTDREGYLWIGTGEGVVKFNGYGLKNVALDGKPSQNFCTALLRHENGMIAGFNDGTIAVSSKNGLTSHRSRAANGIAALARHGEFTYAASQKAVYLAGQENLTQLFLLPGDDLIYDMISWGKSLLVATSTGLYLVEPGSGKSVKLSSLPSYKLLNRDGNLFFLGDSALYALDGNRVQPVHRFGANIRIQESSDLTYIRNSFFISAGNQLMQLHAEKDGYAEKSFYLEDNNLLINTLQAVNGQLWLGTYGKGLAFLDPSSYFIHPGNGGQPTLGLGRTSRNLLEVTRNAVKLFNSGIDGEPRFPAYGIFVSAVPLTGAITATPENIYVGTENQGVYKLNTTSGELAPARDINLQLPQGKSILWLHYAADGRMFVSVSQHGVFVFAGEAMTDHYSTGNGLLHNEIYKTYTDSRGVAWFISQSSGLARLKDDKWDYFTLNDGLSSLEFTDITEDETGSIWLSTAGGGLTRIRGRQVDNFNSGSGLSADYFYSISSRKNLIYACTREGINILQGTRLSRITAREIGMIPSFSPRSLLLGSNWLVAGSDRGLIFHFSAPQPQVSHVRMLVKEAVVNDKNTIREGQSLTYGNYKLAFHVEKICLNPYYETELEYMLDGFDKEWQPLSRESVVYQSVLDNNYRFLVREKGNPSNVTVFSFRIEEPFWKKPGYYVMGVLLVAGFVYLFFRYRLRRLEERNRALEEKVAERTAELMRKNKELEQFSYAISHDLKNPAINIVELVRILREETGDDPEMAKEVFQQLDKSSGKLLRTLLDLISFLKQTSGRELPRQAVDIREVLGEIRESIGHSISEAGAEIREDLSGYEHIFYNRTQLYSILYNLVSNAVKYHRQDASPVVTIKTFIKNGEYFLSVKDNGLGIDLKKDGKKLFQRFERMHTHVEGSGIGLHLVKSIVTKNGGDISVKSEPGKGTEFILKLLPAQH